MIPDDTLTQWQALTDAAPRLAPANAETARCELFRPVSELFPVYETAGSHRSPPGVWA